MNLKKGEVLCVHITDLAFGGAGVGRIVRGDANNMVVFVEGGVPGDIVSAMVTRTQPQYAEAKLLEIVEASPQRIAPRCPHFGPAPLLSGSGAGCGGCSLQFIEYADQLKWKEKMVKDALKKIGGFDVEISPIVACASPWFYRNKMEYSFGEGRRAPTQDPTAERDTAREASHGESADHVNEPQFTLGLHEKKRFDAVFDLQECFLQSPRSVEILHAVRTWAISKNLTAFDPRTHTGLLRTLTVREGKNTGECMVNLGVNGVHFPHDDSLAKFIAEKFPEVTSLYRTSVTIKPGRRTAIDEILLRGKRTLTEILKVRTSIQPEPIAITFEILPQAFFQPNTLQAQILYEHVLKASGPLQNKHVWDLFCGTGTIGLVMAKAGAHVAAIDVNRDAIENARENARINAVTAIEFFYADVERMLIHAQSRKLTPPYLIIVDPPRAGIAPRTLEKLAAMKVPRWVYVSCNPSTLARDLRSLARKGYKIKSVQPIDMFPQTYHIETVTTLTL